MIEDPSGQFLYASNFDNSSVRGARIQSTGELQDLKKGTTFQINGSPTCLTKSGRTS